MKYFNGIGLAILLLLMMIGVSSCKTEWRSWSDSDDDMELTEYRSLKNFEKIEISGSPRIFYTQADSFSVHVVGPETSVENLITEVNGQTLYLHNRRKASVVNISMDDEDVKVYVTSPDLTGVRLNGSGDFSSTEKIDSDKLDLVLHGSGDMDIKDIICDDCHVELVGSGDISLNRLEARGVSVFLVGSGDVGLSLHRVDFTKLALKGSGDIDAHFSDGSRAVDCDLHGSGDINLVGSLDKFTSHKNGSGDVDMTGLNIRK